MKSKFNNAKRGFTIVELVIVIAIIAILAAVLIPTFSSLVQSAQMASDTSLITNLNKELAMAEAQDGKNATMSDVIADLEDAGYSLALLTPTAEGCYIAWDADTDRVVYMDSDFKILYPKEQKGETLANAWQIAHNKEQLEKYAASGKPFNVYLASGFDATELLEISYGIDVGDNTGIEKISYVNSEVANNVIIRTNGGTLEVNAPNATLNHYGYSEFIDVQAVKDSSLHEYGTSDMVAIKSGRVVFETVDSANTVVFVEANSAIVAVADSIQIPEIKRAAEVNSFEIQTVSANGSTATKSTVTIANDTVTITTKDNNGNDTTVPSSVNLETVKNSVNATSDKETVKKENLPTTITTFEELKAFIASNNVKGVIGANFDVSEVLNVTSNKTLDLNGYKLTATLSNGRMFHLNNGCTSFTINGVKAGSELTIADNARTCYGFIKISNKLTLTLNGGHYSGITYNGAFIRMDNTGIANNSIVNFNNCYMETSGQSYGFINSFSEELSEFNVIGGTYIFGGTNKKCGPFEITFDNGIFDSVVVVAAQGPVIENHKNVTIKNCTFGKPVGGNSWDAAAIAGSGSTSVTTVESGLYDGSYAVYTYSTGGKIIVKGGSFKGSVATIRADSGNGNQTQDAVIEIHDGEFDGKIIANGSTNYKSSIHIFGGNFVNTSFECKNNNSEIVISGGKFSADPTSYLAEGYQAIANNGVWTVTKK